MITLEPCALNAEFQNFTLGFNKLPYFADTTERRDRRRKEAQRQGDFTTYFLVMVVLLTHIHVI
jgi:hypothetical protein